MANPEILSINYQSKEEAQEKYKKLPEGVKSAMATDYQKAFGGKPWYERYTCTGTDNCGFLPEPFCPKCKTDVNIKEAYPTDWLINKYFPEMVSEFVPGILGIIRTDNEIPGFTTGGYCYLDMLIQKKNGKNFEEILASIVNNFSLRRDQRVFYDNETCILPERQGSGLGPRLSIYRIEQAKILEAEIICGRTINFSWLQTKEKQFRSKGFDFDYFIPEGDTYSVEGNPRYFYLARMVK